MGSRLGRRVVHFMNLPIKLQMPTKFDNIREISLKTIPSASKIEIKRVLESLYGFDVEKVLTLNMEGKKKKRGGLLIAKPDYKKAYVTLKSPLSLSSDLYPIVAVLDEKERKEKTASSFVDDGKRHWLDRGRNVDGDGNGPRRTNTWSYSKERTTKTKKDKGSLGDVADAAAVKFPWSSMRSR
ncbi:hypothetical protein Ddye_008816 [Dipteronia dyeriana]|uniref:Large ribosomal subunit protein uL23m n=1 Tax=Dipteronia dyeriana TaxID=168575 RepID=A0AAE0CLR9_9ROSI|nr:hypothetical protein Ddye_008816 [Dipteronia dyeriana]